MWCDLGISIDICFIYIIYVYMCVPPIYVYPDMKVAGSLSIVGRKFNAPWAAKSSWNYSKPEGLRTESNGTDKDARLKVYLCMCIYIYIYMCMTV